MRPRDTSQRGLQFSEGGAVWAAMAPVVQRQVVDLLRQLLLQAFRRWLEVTRDQ